MILCQPAAFCAFHVFPFCLYSPLIPNAWNISPLKEDSPFFSLCAQDPAKSDTDAQPWQARPQQE